MHEIRMKRTLSRDSVWKMPVVASLRVPWVETASFVLCHLEVLAGRRLGPFQVALWASFATEMLNAFLSV